MPVVISSAPVGSSQSNTSGRFTMARAIATRCTRPPRVARIEQPFLADRMGRSGSTLPFAPSLG